MPSEESETAIHLVMFSLVVGVVVSTVVYLLGWMLITGEWMGQASGWGESMVVLLLLFPTAGLALLISDRLASWFTPSAAQ